jgi:hypothetical protein
MKLAQLFEKELPITKTDKSYRVTKTDRKKLADNYISSGYFGDVYSTDDDISKVTKFSRMNKKKWNADGYYNYIKKIHALSNFVYLPQIFSVDRYETKDKVPYLVVTMERLTGLLKFSGEELLNVLKRITGDSYSVEISSLIEDYELYRNKYDIIDLIINLIGIAINPKNYPELPKHFKGLKIEDPELMKAIKIVRNLVDQGYTDDIHDANIMARRTPYGPQLVMLDPLAFFKKSNIKLKFKK